MMVVSCSKVSQKKRELKASSGFCVFHTNSREYETISVDDDWILNPESMALKV